MSPVSVAARAIYSKTAQKETISIMSNIFLSCISGVLLFFSCDTRKKYQMENVTLPVKENEIIPYTENFSKANDPSGTLFIKNLANLMRLPDLHKEQSGNHLRIWVWESTKKVVLDIWASASDTTGRIIEFKSLYRREQPFVHIQGVQELRPINGWHRLFDSLHNYKITSLPTRDKERGGSLTEASNIEFETVQANRYSYSKFKEPGYYRNVDAGSGNVYRLLKFLEHEFAVPIYNLDENFLAD